MHRSPRIERAVFAAAIFAAAGCRGPEGGHRDHGAAPAASVRVTAATIIAGEGHQGHEGHASLPHGYAAVSLEKGQGAALGLRTAEVTERDFARRVRTVGVVVLDETRTSHVHAKVRGWLDGINVSFVGRKVVPGEVLCSIYSQEVYAAELEFLSVLDSTRNRPAASGEFAEAERRAEMQLLEAARRRLSLWDVPKTEIERLESTHEAKRTFPLLAPRAGEVIAKQALEGMFVEPSLELYTLSDLSHVWVLVDVYEADVPYIHLGQTAHLDIEGTESGRDASVTFLSPTVDEATRTLKARFELRNSDRKLRPGAFVTVTMDLGLARGLAVPESAVIRTGARSIVFVAHGEEHLEPREIEIGPLVSDYYPVRSGLSVGDHVATGAQFLLDSESRLRATSGAGGGHVH